MKVVSRLNPQVYKRLLLDDLGMFPRQHSKREADRNLFCFSQSAFVLMTSSRNISPRDNYELGHIAQLMTLCFDSLSCLQLESHKIT